MNCQSLKNIYKNTMEIWIDHEDQIDDFIDNLKMFETVGNLLPKEKARIPVYL